MAFLYERNSLARNQPKQEPKLFREEKARLWINGNTTSGATILRLLVTRALNNERTILLSVAAAKQAEKEKWHLPKKIPCGIAKY